MNAFVIDTFEFCRLNERREGSFAVNELPRLRAEAVDDAGAVAWSLQGGIDSQGHPQMVLRISGSVTLECQRCLAPFAFDLSSEAVLVVAADEASADELDALLADTPVEVIVGSRNFDIKPLVEDEALLVIPPSPRHETCAATLSSEADESPVRESPFAVLKNLKQ